MDLKLQKCLIVITHKEGKGGLGGWEQVEEMGGESSLEITTPGD